MGGRPRHLEPGDLIGRWIILSHGPFVRGAMKRTQYECRCECGTIRKMTRQNLLAGSMSCGCLRHERALSALVTHGHNINGRPSRTYRIWQGLWARCTNPNKKYYHRYGGRGITVCDRWRDFSIFLADMGEAPNGMEIDRIDNNGNYEPTNCRWATHSEQSANTSRTRFISSDGNLIALSHACRNVGVCVSSVYYRMKYLNESVQKAFDHLVRRVSK